MRVKCRHRIIYYKERTCRHQSKHNIACTNNTIIIEVDVGRSLEKGLVKILTAVIWMIRNNFRSSKGEVRQNAYHAESGFSVLN